MMVLIEREQLQLVETNLLRIKTFVLFQKEICPSQIVVFLVRRDSPTVNGIILTDFKKDRLEFFTNPIRQEKRIFFCVFAVEN